MLYGIAVEKFNTFWYQKLIEYGTAVFSENSYKDMDNLLQYKQPRVDLG